MHRDAVRRALKERFEPSLEQPTASTPLGHRRLGPIDGNSPARTGSECRADLTIVAFVAACRAVHNKIQPLEKPNGEPPQLAAQDIFT
jgi:hypothetical protein